MTCLYEVTMDVLIRAFMYIANYRSWLKHFSTGKGSDYESFKLKITTMCGDPKILLDAIKSYPGVEDLNTMDYALKGLSCLDLPNESLICHHVWVVTYIDSIK